MIIFDLAYESEEATSALWNNNVIQLYRDNIIRNDFYWGEYLLIFEQFKQYKNIEKGQVKI